MGWVMTIAREIRELDQDYAWLQANKHLIAEKNYHILCAENRFAHENMMKELAVHLESL